MNLRSSPRCPHFRFGIAPLRVEVRLKRSVNDKARIDSKGQTDPSEHVLPSHPTVATGSLQFRTQAPFR